MHMLISFAYLRGKPFIDVEQLSECLWFFLDSGAFTEHGKEIKAARQAKTSENPITLNEYCSFLNGKIDKMYGAIALDRVGDAEQSRRNLFEMVDRGLRPVPVLTLAEAAEEVNTYAEINKIICVAGGAEAARTDWALRRYKEVASAASDEVYLHGLGYTRFPSLFTSALHSGDSSSFVSGSRFGSIPQFTMQGIKSAKPQEFNATHAAKLLPLKVDIAAIRRRDKDQVTGGMGIPACAGGIAYSKFARMAWNYNKRLFIALSTVVDFNNAIAGYYCVNIDPSPKTFAEYLDLRRSIVVNGRLADWIYKEMKAIKDATMRAPKEQL